MANRLSNRGMAKSDGHIARKERQMFGRRVADGSKRPDRCLQATEEQENREDPHRSGPSIDMSGLT